MATNEKAKPSGEPKSPGRTSSLAVRFDAALRLSLTVAILAVSFHLVTLFRGSSRPAAAKPRPVEAAPASPVPDWAAVFRQGGAWSFGRETLAVGWREGDAASLAAEWNAPADSAAASGVPGPAERQLLNWADRLGKWMLQPNGDLLVRGVFNGGKVYVRVRKVGAARRFVEAKAAWPLSKNRVAIATARPSASASRDGAQSEMPPLPTGVATIAQRWDGLGRSNAALIGKVGETATLTSSWRQAGWNVERLSNLPSDGEAWSCSKDSLRVLAWKFAAPTSPGGSVLFLVAAPPDRS